MVRTGRNQEWPHVVGNEHGGRLTICGAREQERPWDHIADGMDAIRHVPAAEAPVDHAIAETSALQLLLLLHRQVEQLLLDLDRPPDAHWRSILFHPFQRFLQTEVAPRFGPTKQTRHDNS